MDYLGRPTKHLHIEFFSQAVEDPQASAKEGRPIFRDAEFVRIKHVGDKNRVNIHPADDPAHRHPETNRWVSYAEKYPQHYEAFKKGRAFIGEGTPLSEVPWLTEAKRAELRAANILTLESLANLEGTPLVKALGMGGRALKEQAQAWLDQAKGSSDVTRLAAENADLRQQMEFLKKQMDEITAETPATRTPAKPKGIDPEARAAFEGMDAGTLKAFIRDRTGETPRGNPAHETLVQMAAEIVADEKAEAEAQAA